MCGHEEPYFRSQLDDAVYYKDLLGRSSTAKSDVHVGLSSTSTDNIDISRQCTEVRKSQKSTNIREEQSDSLLAKPLA